MKGRNLGIIILLVILGTVILSATYTVDEREKAIVFQFGEILRADDKPGIHFKTPFINNVRKFDARIQTMDAEPESYLTEEKRT